MRRFLVPIAIATIAIATPAASQSTAPSSAQSITSLQPGQQLAVRFKFTKVFSADGINKVGEVQDIILESGRVVAYVIGIGGFLGIGQKDIAFPVTEFTVKGDDLIFRSSKESLKNAAKFEWPPKR